MSGLIKSLRRAVQPSLPARIDWGNPLTRGLRQVVNAATPDYNPAADAKNTLTSVANVALPAGLGVGLAFGGGTSPGLTTSEQISGDRTVLLLALAKNIGVTKVYATSSTGAGAAWWLGQNGASWSLGGQIEASITFNVVQCVATTRQGSTDTMYVDGLAKNSANTGLSDGSGGTSFLSFGTTGFDVLATDGGMQLALVWDRALSAGEIAEISENPWQVFAPARRQWLLPAAAAGGSASGSYDTTTADVVFSGGAQSGSSGAYSATTADAVFSGGATGGSAPDKFDVTTTTDTIGGQIIRVLVPNAESANPYNSSNPTPAILYVHGAGEGYTALTSDALKAGVVDALADAGYLLAESAGHDDNWGTQAAVDDYLALEKYLRDNYNIKGVAVWSQSMGGLAGLNLINQSKVPLLGWLGTYPVCNLADMHAGAYASSINTAYGVTGVGNATYANKTYGMDPALRGASAYRDTPMRFYASSGDTVVAKAANTDTLAAIVAGSRTEAAVVVCSGDHGDPSHFVPAEYVDFFDRCFAATSRTITLTVRDASGNLLTGLTGLKWAFYETTTPGALLAPVAQGSAETTDGSGVLSISVTTRLASGATGWLELTDSDGTTTQSPPPKAFSGPVVVT